jgi:hypothetical protein
MKLKNLLITITAFSIAMGFLESSVVVYLREILYPDGFDFPLSSLPSGLGLTELLREAATLVMLVSIGILAGRSFSTGFAWFIFCFAIWDIFYYVFLWLLLGWPESLMTWDILFLIPTTWTGPVLAPVLVSFTMILLALVILTGAEKGIATRIPSRIWTGLILGSLILIWGFIFDYTRHMLIHFSFFEMFQWKNPEIMEVATRYIPDRFPWWIFAAGEIIILASTAWYWKLLQAETKS